MGCCTGFARMLLVIFNFIFWLTGAAMLGMGIWILVDPEIDDYQEVIEDASSDGNFLKTTAYILIGFGALVFLIGFCGCCGAIRKSKCLLGFYIFFLVIIFAGELAAVIYVAIYKDKAEDDLTEGLVKSIKDHYNSMKSAWDKVQTELECCGGKGPEDYKNSTWVQANPSLEIPKSCCKDSAIDCQTMQADTFYDKGCKAALEDWMNDNGYIVIGVGAGIAALQIVIFICAVCFCRNMEDDKYSN